MPRLRQILIACTLQWLPLAALIAILSGTIYAAVQQSYRSSANDPQIQMALDARNALEDGASPRSLVPATTLDISRSLAPYLIIYDANGRIMAASATLHGESLVPPAGVFDSARASDMDVITWTPEPGVRSAIVLLHYPGGYVLAGRSLLLVEERESELELLVGAGCAAALIGTFIAAACSRLLASSPALRNRVAS